MGTAYRKDVSGYTCPECKKGQVFQEWIRVTVAFEPVPVERPGEYGCRAEGCNWQALDLPAQPQKPNA